ncbi:MAG: LysE family transporter [Bacteroidales bacterium]|nr:LysE family transporter [Bacteroidales bacterium]
MPIVSYILKGLIIGICAEAPIGPVAIYVTQKTLSGGRKAGFLAGLGACTVDTTYSVLAIFAYAYAQEFLLGHKEIILLAGGMVVTMMGMIMAVSNPFRKLRRASEKTSGLSPTDFIQAIFLALSNPGAIAVIFALFAFFQLNTEAQSFTSVLPIILSIAGGAICYWWNFTTVLNHFRKKIDMHSILIINRIAGAIVVVIGIALFAEGAYHLLFTGLGAK